VERKFMTIQQFSGHTAECFLSDKNYFFLSFVILFVLFFVRRHDNCHHHHHDDVLIQYVHGDGDDDDRSHSKLHHICSHMLAYDKGISTHSFEINLAKN
jgi:hypothetical protein